jgi:hypothetical protein
MKVGAFVDTYYSQNWNGPKPQADANTFHPYNNNAGFGLAWVGLDTAIDTGSVGGALQLRFGPSVPNLALGDFKVPGGIGYVQNGYATWKPGGTGGRLTLLAGKFDTVYGAEVAQSYLNMNYTRGALYNLAQPFFHTGVRADWQATDQLALKLMAVNGWNNTIDNNRGKSFGTQVTYTPSDVFAMSVGYMGGPEGSDTEPVSGGGLANVPDANGELRHLVDVVVDVKPTSDLRIVANADYVADKTKGASTSWYGASLLGRYAFSSMFAAALRGEYIADKNGVLTATQKDTSLVTGTLTLEATPSKYLVLRLDNRIDVASEEVYKVGIDSTSGTMFTTTLGVVAKTN